MPPSAMPPSSSLPPALVSRLARLTSLDEETITAQIVPYLASLSSNGNALRHHLMDLVGPGEEQRGVVEDCVRAMSGGGGGRSGSGTKEGAKVHANANAKGLSSNVSDKPSAATSSNANASSSKTNSQAGAGSSTMKPNPRAHKTTTTIPSASTQAQTQAKSSPSLQPPPPAPPAFNLSPSEEMQRLDEEIARLTTNAATSAPSSSSSATPTPMSPPRLTCYCQGRKHPLFTHKPLCTSCGLLLCSRNTPHPYTPDSSCPSCDAPLLASADRAVLLSDLHAKRLDAESRALAKAEQVRLERQQRRDREKEDVDETALFPQLGGGDVAARNRALELDYAMGRKQRGGGDILSPSTPSSSSAKGRVLTIGKKGKVYVGDGPQAAKKKKKAEAAAAAAAAAAKGATSTASAGQTTTAASTPSASQPSSPPPTRSPSPPPFDADAEAERLGLVIDHHDDGRRAKTAAAKTNDGDDAAAVASSSSLLIRYIPPGERKWQDHDGGGGGGGDDEQGDGTATAPRRVVGAATGKKAPAVRVR